jgi:xylan 1,4-beta-xylosidase
MIRLFLLVIFTSFAFAEPVMFTSFDYTGRDEIFDAPISEYEYRNPILAGYYPDPSICQVGEDYYLINSSFAHFPGLPVFHSKDLVNWTQIGHAIDRPDQLPYDGVGITRALFAPAISYHDGLFYIVCTMIDAGGNFLITTEDPTGPWSDPVWLDFDGIDPSLCFDESTGRAWMVNNGEPPDNKPLYSGHRAIWVQEWDIAAKKLFGPRKIIINGGVDLAKKPVWIEGPHIYKRGDWYYLNCAEGGTSDYHSQVIFRSRAPDGPYVPFTDHPTLTQRDLDPDRDHPVTCTGHADFVIGPDGNWWSVFLGCTPYEGGHYNTGRQTFLLPITWKDGWPMILPPGAPVPYVHRGPNGVGLVEPTGIVVAGVADPGASVSTGHSTGPGSATPATATAATGRLPLTGNFTWRDDFGTEKLGLPWLFLRAPQTTWWSTGDGLKIEPRTDSLREMHNPSFIGRRLQHNRFEVATELVLPTEMGVETGLVAYHNETRHYVLGVSREGEGYRVFLEAQRGAPENTQITTGHLTAKLGTKITLRLTGHDTDYVFDYSTDAGKTWTQVGGIFDARNLSVATSYDFIGVLVGVMARR